MSQTLDKGHGRLETRRCTVVVAPAYLEELAHWKEVRTLAAQHLAAEYWQRNSSSGTHWQRNTGSGIVDTAGFE